MNTSFNLIMDLQFQNSLKLQLILFALRVYLRLKILHSPGGCVNSNYCHSLLPSRVEGIFLSCRNKMEKEKVATSAIPVIEVDDKEVLEAEGGC
jgi:hypothetical protein